MSTRRKLLLAAPLIFLLVAGAVLWGAGGVLTAPARQNVGALPPDLPGRPVAFASSSGATLKGWLIPGRKNAGAVVLLHGVRANRLSMVGRARFLARDGYTVLLFDFQAHGESEGERITFGARESLDAQAAVDFLCAQAPGEKIGVVGVSLGGAAALLAAPPLPVDALVLEMVYPDITRATNNRLALYLGRWAGVLTPALTWQLKPRLGVDVSDLRPLDHVGAVTAPKLFIAGAEDRHTTLAESRELFTAAREPKDMWVVAGAAHVDLHAVAGPEYERRVLAFFKQYLQGAG